ANVGELGLIVLLCGGNGSLCRGYIGIGSGNGGLVGGKHNGNVGALGAHLSLGLSHAGLGLVESDLIITRVELDEDFTCRNSLIVFDVYSSHSAADSCADAVEMAVDLRVVGGLIRTEVQEQNDGKDDRDHEAGSCKKNSFAVLLNIRGHPAL